jgi:hypothetical protein
MISRTLPVLVALIVLSGCATVPVTSGGISGYYSNQPNGVPRFRISQGIGGYKMSVFTGEGWTEGRPMKVASETEKELSAIPWFAQLVETAWSIDGFLFLKFKPGAELNGEKLPTSYALAPGGYAYRVAAPKSKSRSTN